MRKAYAFTLIIFFSLVLMSTSQIVERDVPPPIVRIHFWIKAFIPKSHPGNPGYVRQVAGTTKFVVPEPVGDACAMTDNRDFSNDPNASARLTTEFLLVIEQNTVTITPAGPKPLLSTGESHRVFCNNGQDFEPPKTASTSNMSIGHPAFADGQAQVVIDGRANYPFIAAAPDVNYGGHITYTLATKKLEFLGSAGVFPAFEAYAQRDNGPIVTVFKLQPGNGTTVMSLVELGTGLQQRRVETTIQL